MKNNECKFKFIDKDFNTWQCSRCGYEWCLDCGTPKENDMNYCPFCGKKII